MISVLWTGNINWENVFIISAINFVMILSSLTYNYSDRYVHNIYSWTECSRKIQFTVKYMRDWVTVSTLSNVHPINVLNANETQANVEVFYFYKSR